MQFRWLTLFVVVVLLTTIGGCDSSGPKTYRISGKATWKGQPIPAGLIFFEPDVHEKNDGPQGYAMIENGEFDTGNGGRNVVAGPHIIRIEGYDGQPGYELPLGRLIFEQYSFDAELPEENSTLDITVPDSVRPLGGR